MTSFRPLGGRAVVNVGKRRRALFLAAAVAGVLFGAGSLLPMWWVPYEASGLPQRNIPPVD